MLVHTIKKVPESIFDNVKDQILSYDLSQTIKNSYIQGFDLYKDEIPFSQEGINPIFLRCHDPIEKLDKPGNFNNKIHPFKNTELLFTDFYNVIELLNWVKNLLKAEDFGNIFINYMQPNGAVSLHTDPGIYFQKHSRFHIPLKTNSQALFDGGPNTVQEHMPVGHLCRLNNLLPHQAYNLGSEVRVHLIIDILLKHGNRVL